MGGDGRVSVGWFPVARGADVGTTPVPVTAGGVPYVVVRLRRGAEVSAFPARCPHRLVPLVTASVVDGALQCPAHGWRFDAEGRCTRVPSLGRDGTPPPRADLATPWAVEERYGWVWIAPERTVMSPPRLVPAPEPAPSPDHPPLPVFDNLDPSLEHAWHPVALSRELRDGGWLQVRLLGRTWRLCREDGAVRADPPAFAVRERLGVVWLAPAEPADVPLDVPEADDPSVATGWLPPLRSPGPAGPLADTFLDASHGAFVHRATLGAAPVTGPVELCHEPGGFRSVQEQAVDDGHVRQLRRTTYEYRAPFQLRLRQEFGSGETTTLLYLLQPEDADSTRIYLRLMLAAGAGQRPPARATVLDRLALQQRILEEDVASQAALRLPGLPLDPRDEVHVPADARGVALRRALCDFRSAGRRLLAA